MEPRSRTEQRGDALDPAALRRDLEALVAATPPFDPRRDPWGPPMDRRARALAVALGPDALDLLPALLERWFQGIPVAALGPGAFPALLALARSGPRPLRRSAARGLGAVGLVDGGPRPIGAAGDLAIAELAVGDADAGVRLCAVRSFLDFPDRRSLASCRALLPALRDPSTRIRRAAVEVIGPLGRRSPREATAIALRLLRDPDPRVREGAAVQLRSVPGPLRLGAAGARLVARLVRGDRSAATRQAGAAILGRARPRVPAAPLLAALRDRDPEVRATAAEALAARPRDPRLLPALAAALRRVECVAPLRPALERLGAPGRTALAATLDRLERSAPAALAEVAATAPGTPAASRRAARVEAALAALGPRAAPLLPRIAEEPALAERFSERRLLAAAGRAGVAALAERARHPDPRVRSAAVAFLGWAPAGRAVDAVVSAAAADPDPTVRDAAAAVAAARRKRR